MFKQYMTKDKTNQMVEELREIRRDLMEKNNPTMFQKMRQATERIQNGEPTMEDYRLVFEYPAMASMFMRNSLKK
jgi:uncharacterized membrane protein